MRDRSVSAGGNIDRSIVITGDGNHASIHFGEGLTLPFARQQRLPRRHRKATAENLLPLLRADSLAFELVGREQELAELRAWLESDADISVQTLTGRAGTGKTRLAIELCGRVDGADKPGKTGWSAGFLRPADIANVVDQLATGQIAKAQPTLLVIDYVSAIHRELAQWFDRLAAADFDGKLRFLLLDREAPENFGWWHELAHPSLSGHRTDLFVDPDRPKRLSDLSDPESRRALFGAALRATSRLLGDQAVVKDAPSQGADTFFDEALTDSRFGNPLNLVMAGLIAAELGVRDALALRRLEAARAIARREVNRMILLGESCGVSAAAMRHSLGFNGLAGGLPLATLRTDLAAELRAADLGAAMGELPDLLERELPQEGREADDGAEPRLGTVQPDLVGEGVIIEALLVGPKSQLAGAAAIVERAYRQGGNRAAEALMRLLQDYGYAAEDPRGSDSERKMGETLLQLLSAIAGSIPDEDILRLEPLVWAFPTHTIVLREAAAAQTQRLARIWRALSESSDQLDEEAATFAKGRSAGWLNNLANRLGDLGRREEALAAAQEAVKLYRTLAAARPDAFTPYLAMSLNNLANQLSALGWREEALAAAQEGADFYRALAAARPDAFTPNLAGSLNNLAGVLSDLGRREEALAAAQEAVELRRALAAAHPDAFTPDLAMSLNNLASVLSGLGRREEALAAAQEGTEFHRALAAARPDAFTPDLALSLNNLANRLSDLGRREEALRAAQEAMEFYRALATARPDAFTPDLAMSLNNLANRLSDLGRREDALAAAEEAAELYRTLAAAHPDAFTPDLAASLNNLANRLSDFGRREEALAAAQEAVELCRMLAAARPDAFAPYLAMSLNNLANQLSALGRREEALAAVQEAGELDRALAAARPDAFTPNLAGSLNNLAGVLSDLGRREEALAVAQEAVELYRALAAARPDRFTPDLAMSLSVLADLLEDIGRLSDAVRADRESIGFLAPYFLARPRAFTNEMIAFLKDHIRRSDLAGTTLELGLVAPIIERLNAIAKEEAQ